MVGPFKVSSGQFPFHCSLGVSTRKARLAGVLHPVVDIVALKVKGGSEKRRWSKKSIGNKAAEEEKICSVEKVGEKGKESAFGKIERIEKLE